MLTRLCISWNHRLRQLRRIVTQIPSCLPRRPNLPVTVSSSPSEVDAWITTHINSAKAPFVGFDIEWRPSFRAGMSQPKAATVQLATSTAALIVQMSHMNNASAGLKETLGSDHVTKVGVGVKEDLKRLQKDYNLCFSGFADIVCANYIVSNTLSDSILSRPILQNDYTEATVQRD